MIWSINSVLRCLSSKALVLLEEDGRRGEETDKAISITYSWVMGGISGLFPVFSLVLGLWGVVVLSTFPILQVLLCGVLSWLSPAAPCQDFVPLLWVDCCQWAWEVWGSDGGAAESLREEQDLFCLEERRLRGI